MNPRRMAAREAARLLYLGLAEEFKQAKEMAALSLGECVLPSNYEIALELERIADEAEGIERRRLIVRLREEALRVMRILEGVQPQAGRERLAGDGQKGQRHRHSGLCPGAG